VDGKLIEPKIIKRTLLDLDSSNITQLVILSNFKTVAEHPAVKRYELIVIKTTGNSTQEDNLTNGFDFMYSQLKYWSSDNPDPVVVIDGIPFKYEEEYRPFLEELTQDDIYAIDELKEESAMRIFNYEYVLLVTTKYGR
jgi:hypothetical protein